MAWHGKTEVNKDLRISSPDLWLRRWEVQEADITATLNGVSIVPVHQKLRALVTSEEIKGEENPLFVSAPFNRDTYSPLTNSEFLRIISEALQAASLPDDVESCGSVFNRRRVFVSIPLPGASEFNAGGREFRGFLNFLNSHDKSCEFMANYSNICVVCNNTFNANLDTGGCIIPHTKNMAARLEGLPDVIARAVGMQEEFTNDFLQLHSREISLSEARLLFASFMAAKDGLSTRAFNQVERLVALFIRGAGNKGETLADAFSACTDLYTHESAGEDVEKQYVSSEFGSGALSKRQAMSFFRGVENDASEFNKECENGNQLLIAYHAETKDRILAKAAKKETLPAPAPEPAPDTPKDTKGTKGKGKGKGKK